MKYLCLVYHKEKEIDALSENEYNAIVNEVLAYREDLRQGGHYITSDPLQFVQTATTIRVRNGKVFITEWQTVSLGRRREDQKSQQQLAVGQQQLSRNRRRARCERSSRDCSYHSMAS